MLLVYVLPHRDRSLKGRDSPIPYTQEKKTIVTMGECILCFSMRLHVAVKTHLCSVNRFSSTFNLPFSTDKYLYTTKRHYKMQPCWHV